MKIQHVILFLTIFQYPGVCQDIQFPSDAGHINLVTEYGLVGDGETDNTTAFQAALNDHALGRDILYLPNGIYLISDMLQYKWRKWNEGADIDTMDSWGPYLIGQSQENTIILLKDSADGFDNPFNPKPMLNTGQGVAQKFSKQIRNLTINTGSGNPYSIGILFYSNNEGMISDVSVISNDSKSYKGIECDFSSQNGPLLIRNTYINGFEIGIGTGSLNSQTISNVTIENVTTAGIVNDGIVSIEGLACKLLNVPAIINKGNMCLINSNFSGTDTSIDAIKNTKNLFARNIHSTGFKGVIETTQSYSPVPEGDTISEFCSHTIYREFTDTEPMSLNLPVKKPPVVPWYELSEWESVVTQGAVPDDGKDDSDAIQQAIDAGKKVVYFPKGTYHLNKTVYIRGNVERIHGMGSEIGGNGKLIFSESAADTVIIEAIKWLRDHNWELVHNSSKTLLIEGFINYFFRGQGTGEVFISDVLTRIKLENPAQKVWARHYDTEDFFTLNQNVHNDGATLWILGFKTEKESTKILTSKNGSTEVIGAHIYPQCKPILDPLFISDNSSCSFAGINTTNNCSLCFNYPVFVREIKNGTTSDFRRTDIGSACKQSFVLYTGRNTCLTEELPDAISGLSFEIKSLSEVWIRWEAPSGNFDGINILKQKEFDVPENLNSLNGDVYEFLASNLDTESNYTYHFVSYNCLGNSDTTKISFTTPEWVALPGSPVEFQAAPIAWNQASLSWKDNSVSERGFILERRPASGSFKVIAELDANITSFMDFGLDPSTKYYYRLHAHNYAGISEYAVTNVTTPDQDVSIENTTLDNITIFPNPAKDIITVRCKDHGVAPTEYSITDSQGRAIRNGKFKPGEYYKTIQLDGLKNGVYVIILFREKKIVLKKIIQLYDEQD